MRVLMVFVSAFFAFGGAVKAEPITEAQLRAHIEVLASDFFEGRKPGTTGENKTVNYIASQWQDAGLIPAAGDGQWYAPVTLVERTPISQMVSLTLQADGKSRLMKITDDQMILRGIMPVGHLTQAQLVFAGYGNLAKSDHKWIDGKLAIMLLRAPSERKNFPDYRTRKQALIDAGALGVLTIIKGKKRWQGSARRYRKGGMNLGGEGSHAPVEGIISAKLFEKIAKKAGLRAGDLIEQASKEGFLPARMPVSAELAIRTDVHQFQSHNVVGKISGKNPEAGAVLYLGHWDHFGTCQKADKSDPTKDLICNGAVDNASGISLLIEAAKRLAATSPDRDIYFLATTAEEKGLLGARAFADNPSFDLDRIVAAFNADTVALSPSGKTIAIVGRGETNLDADLEKVAKAEGRLIDKSDKANAFLKRQDGYVFLEKDIPTFMITSAFADQTRLDSYLTGRYHQVTDEADDGLILGGAVSDANFHVALGRYFSNIASYPAKAP